MTDRPILFSAPMVRALLAGRKTQTRRLVKPSPKMFGAEYDSMWNPHVLRPGGSIPDEWSFWEGPSHGPSLYHTWKAPIEVGDRLWVRETYMPRPGMGKLSRPHYRADTDRPEWRHLWKPSIHMPRWASRLTLTVTDVRVERLQSICETDAEAEGIYWETHLGWTVDGEVGNSEEASIEYCRLWDSINGRRKGASWDDNPWISAYTFTVEKRNIDHV